MQLNKKYYKWIIELLIILMILFSVRLWVQRDVASGMAPNIVAPVLDGAYFNLHQSNKKPMLIYFWANWCPVCKLQQGNINDIAKDHPVMTIAMQSGTNAELREFMQQENLSFKVINDELAMLSNLYSIKGVPIAFIINKENEIQFVEVGYTTELGLRLRLWWASL